FEGSLQGTVLAMAPVQGNEHPIKTRIDQINQRIAAGVEQVGVDALAAQGLVYALPRHQGHFTLGGASAVQHADPAEVHSHTVTPNWAGTRLIEPAPITTITSPSCAKSRMA